MKNRICVAQFGLAACVLLLACSAMAQSAGETRRSRMVLADRGLPPLHLKSHIVNAAITGRIAKITAESVYRNDSSRELEATFVFPLPEGATVERFTMWMNGEPVEAKVAEKDRARATYESIVNRKKDPGLIEQIGDGLFQMRVYPVLPNSDQKVRIEYSQVIPMNQNGKALLFSYPLACDAPRTPEASIVTDFVVALTLDMEGPIASLESDTHRISRHIDANQKHKARVSIEEGLATLDKDFILKIALEKKASPVSVLAYRPPADGNNAEDGTMMIFITPELPEGEALPGKDVVMVMDTSGSMSGHKFDQAKRALHECLNRLRTSDRFAIVSFSDGSTVFKKEWCEAKETEIAAARTFVDGLRDAGGTNIGEAVTQALAYPAQDGRPRYILFATDGCPTVGECDIQKLAGLATTDVKGAELTRFFTFGIGYDVNTVLLDKISSATRGERAYVKQSERIEQKLAELCDKIGAPVLSDVSISFSDNLSVQQMYPPRAGDLYLGRQMVLTARYKGTGEGTLTIKGKRGGKDVVIETPLKLEAATPQATAFLTRQWALRKVGFLLDQMRLNGANAELKDEVVRLGTRFNIVTPYTSYLALEHADRQRFDAVTSKEHSNIVVPPDILARAELGDHFETVNPDRPDTQSRFGNPDAHLFRRDDSSSGGGGNSLDNMIGVGGAASPGMGGGWGGGNGTGSGRGSFGNRNGGGRRLMVKRHGGSKGTENSVDRALRWLAAHQEAGGQWDSIKLGATGNSDITVTSYALQALLAAGHTEKIGEHKDCVQRAVAWLISKQNDKGMIVETGDASTLNDAHLLAAMALAEATDMSNIPATRAAAQKALDYSAGLSAELPSATLSAAPQKFSLLNYVIHLKTAKLAGLSVPHTAFDACIKALDALEKKGGDNVSRFVSGAGQTATDTTATALALLSRQFLGWKMEELEASIDALVTEGGLPEWNAQTKSLPLMKWQVSTTCAFARGGDTWKKWNTAMTEALIRNQATAGDDSGSWPHAGSDVAHLGTAGSTALCCLTFETYYRYASQQSATPVAVPPQTPVIAPKVPTSDSGKDAVDYSEYIRQLQEGKQ